MFKVSGLFKDYNFHLAQIYLIEMNVLSLNYCLSKFVQEVAKYIFLQTVVIPQEECVVLLSPFLDFWQRKCVKMYCYFLLKRVPREVVCSCWYLCFKYF